MSYAIYWHEGELGPRYVGRLEFGDSSVELSGSAQADRSLLSLPFECIASVGLTGRTMRIARREGAELSIGSVDGPGSLREVAGRLASLVTYPAREPLAVTLRGR